MNDDVRLLKMQIVLMKEGIDVDTAERLAKELASIAEMAPQVPVITYPTYPTYPDQPVYPGIQPYTPWYTITTTDGIIDKRPAESTAKN